MQKIGLRILSGQEVIYLANGDGSWENHTIGVSRCLKAISNLNDGSDLYVLQYTPGGCYIDILRYDYEGRGWRQGCLFVPKDIKVEYFFLQSIVSEVEKHLAQGKLKKKKLDSYLSETYKPKRTVPDVQIVNRDGMAVYYFDERKPLSEVMTGKNLFRESLTSYGTVLLIGAHTGMTAPELSVISKLGPGEIIVKGTKVKKRLSKEEKARRNMIIAMAVALVLVIAGGVGLWQYHRYSAQQAELEALQKQRDDSIKQAALDSAAHMQAMNDSLMQVQAQEQAQQLESGELIAVPDGDGSLKNLMLAFFSKWASVACSSEGLAYGNGADSGFGTIRELSSNAVQLGDSLSQAICQVQQIDGGMTQFTYKSKQRQTLPDGTLDQAATVETFTYIYDPGTKMMTQRNHSRRQQGTSSRRSKASEQSAEGEADKEPQKVKL